MTFEVGSTGGAFWIAPAAIALACSSASDPLFSDATRGGRSAVSAGGSVAAGGASSLGGSFSAGRGGAFSSQGGEKSGTSGGTAGAAGNRALSGAGGRPATGGNAGLSGGGASGAAGSGGDTGDAGAIGDAGANGDAGEGGQGGGDGCVGDDPSCRRPVSCDELHRVSPSLPSGRYTLRPLGSPAEFSAYCEMLAEGGGWTLVFNMGPTFDRSVTGVAGALCYDTSCTNLSYSSVLLRADIMLDISDTPIAGGSYTARAIVTGVELATRGKTVRALFNSGPNFIERDDNSNLVLRLNGTGSCSDLLQEDMQGVLCTECPNNLACGGAVLVFGDSDSGCVDPGTVTFAIGAATSRAAPWTNCAGWPQSPNLGGGNYYPDYFRIWVR